MSTAGVERLLVVFTRYPEQGIVKTRLIPALGSSGAALLQREMTARTLARVTKSPWNNFSWETLVRFAGGDCEAMRCWIGGSPRCVLQGTGDLGERLRRAFAEGFAGGATSIAVVGTDCPELGAADVADAFRALEGSEVVFGPARDGGYWLIGIRRAAFATASELLFAGIGWGGAAVLEQSRAAAARGRLAVSCLRMLDDVDRPEDVPVWERAQEADRAGETITVVVPALDEAVRIGALVEALRSAAGVEVIVADGGSVDGTPMAAAAAGARVAACTRGRALQMNAGAAAATGAILLFLHADTRLPVGWTAAVRALLRQPGIAGGCFSFATDSTSATMRLVESVANWRGRLLGIVFGDQAIFMRREQFESLGGFPDVPLMEDYELVRGLRRCGKLVVLPQRAVTSARRWEARGPWRNSLKNAAITLAYLAGVSPERLSRWYSREYRRQNPGTG